MTDHVPRYKYLVCMQILYISILAYPLKGSTTIALGSCKSMLNSVNLFPPSSSATSIMLNPPSVQYIFLPTQSIAIPSGVCTSDIRTSTFPVMENTTREHVKTKQRTVNCVSNTKSMQTPANKLEPRVYELSQTPGMVTHRLSAMIVNQACFWSLSGAFLEYNTSPYLSDIPEIPKESIYCLQIRDRKLYWKTSRTWAIHGSS